jgi:hypothetical protein
MTDQQHDADTPSTVSDGIGLDLESVRTLLAQKHATVVDPDDPVLMLVTLQNAFLAEYEKLLARHNKALTSMLAERRTATCPASFRPPKGWPRISPPLRWKNIRTILQGTSQRSLPFAKISPGCGHRDHLCLGQRGRVRLAGAGVAMDRLQASLTPQPRADHHGGAS